MMRTVAEAVDCCVTVDYRCRTDESSHWGRVNVESRYYQCDTDAFLLGISRKETVTVRTVSPVSETGLVVEYDADGIVATTEWPVLSVLVEGSIEASDGPDRPEPIYGRFYPFNKAIASRGEYEQWTAANTEVVSVANPPTSHSTCRNTSLETRTQ